MGGGASKRRSDPRELAPDISKLSHYQKIQYEAYAFPKHQLSLLEHLPHDTLGVIASFLCNSSDASALIATSHAIAHIVSQWWVDLRVFCPGGHQKLVRNFLVRFPNLRTLDVSWSNITELDLSIGISAMKNIVELNMQRCPGVTDELIERISGLERLRVLNIAYCPNVTPRSIEDAAMLPKLEELNIAGNKMSEHALASLREAKRLNFLNVNRSTTLGRFGSICDSLSRLTSLMMYKCCQVGDEDLVGIGRHLVRLEKLVVGRCVEIGDVGITALSPLPSLSMLLISECPKVTSIGVDSLTASRSLQDLEMWGCHHVSGDSVWRLVTSLVKLRRVVIGPPTGTAACEVKRRCGMVDEETECRIFEVVQIM